MAEGFESLETHGYRAASDKMPLVIPAEELCIYFRVDSEPLSASIWPALSGGIDGWHMERTLVRVRFFVSEVEICFQKPCNSTEKQFLPKFRPRKLNFESPKDADLLDSILNMEELCWASDRDVWDFKVKSATSRSHPPLLKSLRQSLGIHLEAPDILRPDICG